jgi:RND superfamily putative drug exporter
VVAVASPASGNLNSALDNSDAAYVAPDAESARVQSALATHQQTTTPTIIVYERPSGITNADKAKASGDASAIASIVGVVGPLDGPRVSADGGSLRTIVPVASGTGGWDQISTPVTAIRAVVGNDGSGLAIHVTGPAAVIADTSAAFNGIDTNLLYTTLAIVVVILLLTYRSPVLWLLPIISVGAALTVAQAVIYLLARHAGLTVNSQSTSILTVLIFGAGTDYALLLIARYREELRRHSHPRDAMAAALRRASPAIIASAATVTAAMICLTVATTASTKGMGPVAAIGILSSLLAVMTLLPALLVSLDRWVFWPRVPAFGSEDRAGHKLWARLGGRISRTPRTIWLTTVVVLFALALGLVGFKAEGINADNAFVTPPDSIIGARVLAAHFPAGDGQPITILTDPSHASAVRDAVAGTPGIAAVGDPAAVGGRVYLEATLREPADSPTAQEDLRHVRVAAHSADPNALVGGTTANLVDTSDAASYDRDRIVPLVLVVVLAILALLLRAVVAPVVLVGTVVLSFAAALGASALLFTKVLHWPGADSSLPLFVFVFLVALGVDYNIFLATRIREEARRLGDTRVAVRDALVATGGVITSAGLVLAGTFAALASLPLIAYAEIGVVVAIGVLIDTAIVRAVLVTALTIDLDRWTWWPSRLTRRATVDDRQIRVAP